MNASTKKRTVAVLAVVLALTIATSMMLTSASADGVVAFHLDFSSFNDISGNDLQTIVGGAVQLNPGGGSTLGDGRTLNSAFWEGVEGEENQIVIVDNPLLDAITITPGSIVTWINPLDGTNGTTSPKHHAKTT